MELPTPHLSLAEINEILYKAKRPERLDAILVSLDAKNGILYREVLADILKRTEGSGLIHRDAIEKILTERIFAAVHRTYQGDLEDLLSASA